MLVFDRSIQRRPVRPFGNFNHVGYAREAQPLASNTQAAKNTYAGTPLSRSLVGARMERGSLERQVVLKPFPFDMNQRALALAEDQVLQTGQR